MARKPTTRKPTGKLSDVKPSRAPSMLRIEQDAEVTSAGEAAATKAKPTRKAAAAKTAKKPVTAKSGADARTTFTHGETRLTHSDEAGRLALEAMTDLIDQVHAMGRVRITSASHGAGTTMMHIVLPGAPTDYESRPGLILAVDGLDGLVSFDHAVIGIASPELIDDAAWSLLTAMAGDDENPANATGRRADWFEAALDAADAVGLRHVRA